MGHRWFYFEGVGLGGAGPEGMACRFATVVCAKAWLLWGELLAGEREVRVCYWKWVWVGRAGRSVYIYLYLYTRLEARSA